MGKTDASVMASYSSVDTEKAELAEKQLSGSEKDQGKKHDGAVSPLEQKLSELPPDEAATLRSQTAASTQSATFFTLYKFAGPWDIFMVIVGVFFAAVHGVALPMFSLVVGAIVNTFNSFIAEKSLSKGEFQHKIDHNALYFVYIGVGMLVSSIIESAVLVHTGEILTGRYRKNYLKAVIRQNIAYFDTVGSGQVTTRITNDTANIQEAISEKLGNVIQGVATFITAIVISFTQQWKLACIMLSVVGFNFISMSLGSRFMLKYQVMAQSIYTNGSTVAEEAISSIRSTIAFGAQERLAAKFDGVLRAALTPAAKSAFALGIMLACMWAGQYWTFTISYWEGSRLIADGHASLGHIMCIAIATLIGAMQLANIAPNIRAIVQGIAACKTINEAINRVPVIDSESTNGLKPTSVEGHIQLKNVRFRYPSRPDVLVLPDFSLDIPAGKTVALVGMSGSGKSTIVGILERFYLPLRGSVTLDGNEITDLNLQWLRQQIGYVQQEPTLFSDTIYENISYGLVGTEYEDAGEEVKRRMVEQACREANAYDFIQTLTEGFDTNVGDRGFLMSGGQKQRIAIARAIVSNPKILLLDEATSALDTKSEGIVQDALDRASQNRTTIVIAHRLSTIKDAHKIVVMSKGEILEQGTHTELLAKGEHYKRLVEAQQVAVLETSENSEENEKPTNGLVIQEDELVKEDQDTKGPAGTNSANESPMGDQIPGVQKPKDGNMWRYMALLWKLNHKEHWMIISGAILMVLLGYCFPAQAMVTGHVISSIIVPSSMFHHMRHAVNVLTAWLFFIGAIAFIVTVPGITLISVSSARLVRSVRLQLFRQFMRLDVAFFDHPDNSPGSLTSILAKEAKAIEGLGGATMGQIMQSMTTLIGGVATGIPFSWRVGLVALATVPVLLGCGFLRVKVMMNLEERGRKVYEGSGAMASQYTSAVRTVQSLTRERSVAERYAEAISKQARDSRPAVLRSAVLYGLSQGLVPWCIALVFWWGSTCLRKNNVDLLQYYTVFLCMVPGAQAAGQVFSYAPDMGKAREAASNVYRILTAKPIIDSWSSNGIVPEPENVEGCIEFHDVHFRYPTRPQVPVLQGLNLTVRKGQYIALVGPSGCGKSTTIGLTERFYNVQSGNILFDGREIADYNLGALRSHIALVQQEPMLYSGTIRENITLGWAGDESEVTDEMIYAVAKKANIHDFVMSLPDGYNTVSGSRGSLLSGGQKQRIAIARALIRNPKVLLLDEATSALDSESEKIVQAALDEAAKGRTTIAVAHRLSTIQKADIIYVFEGGQIVEKGDHQTLLKLNGRYAELVRLQSLEG